MFNFNRDRVNWDQPIGDGFYGIIYPYQKHPEDKKWVVKRVIAKNSQDLAMFLQEITICLSCDSPYIMPIRGYYVEHMQDQGEWEVYMRMPRMKTSLNWVLEDHKLRNRYIPEDMIVQYLYAMAKGLQHMHERGLAHRDIKPENVLLSEDGHIKVTDLGLSSFCGGDASEVVEILGDPVYAAPENQEGNTELRKKDLYNTDLWSLGVTLVELCAQVDVRKLNMGISREGYEEGIKRIEALEGNEYSKNLIDMIKSLLQHQPEERKSLRDVVEELEMRYGNTLSNLRSCGVIKRLLVNKNFPEELEEQVKRNDIELSWNSLEFIPEGKCS